MDNIYLEQRKSGITHIGDVPWGTSFCYFYRSINDNLDVLIPFFRADLENNEYCIWVTSESAVPKAPDDFQEYLDKKQIEVIPQHRWYAKSKNPQNEILSRLDEAILHGYDGLRLAVTPILVNIEDAGQNEKELDIIGKSNVIAFFSYPRSRFDAAGLMELMKNYRFALVRNVDKLEVIESSEARIVKDTLAKNEDRLRSIFSYMAEGFAHHRIVLDKNGKPFDYIFLEINDAFEKIVGLNAKDILGKRVTQALPGIEKDPADWIGRYGKVALTGEPEHFDSYSEVLKRWYSVSAFSTQKGFFTVIFTDITERKRVESELESIAAQRKLALDAASMGWWHYDPIKRYSRWDERYKEIFGFNVYEKPNDEILASRIHPEDLTRTWAKVEAALDPVNPQSYDAEYRINLPDGSVHWIEAHGIATFEGAGKDRHAISLVGTVADITGRKEAAEALKESEEKFSRAFRANPAAMSITDFNDSTFIDVNDSYIRLLGFSRDELIGCRASGLGIWLRTEDRASMMDILQKQGRVTSSETLFGRKDGGLINVLFSAEKINLGGRVCIIGIADDITELKKTEDELTRLNRELRAISDCNQVIVRANNEQELLTNVCRIMCDVVGYRLSWIGIVEHDDAKSVRPVAWYGEDKGYLATANISWADTERGRGPTGTAARKGKTEFVQDFINDPKAAPWRDGALARGFHSSIAMPLFDNEHHVFAVFTLYAAEPDGFNPAEVRLLEELAGDLSFGINVLRTREERRKAEKSLKESEERFRVIAETSPVQISVSRLEDGKILFVNKAYVEAFGFEPEEHTGRKGTDLYVNPDDRDKLIKILGQQGNVKDYEVMVKKFDGTPFWISTSVRPIYYAGESALLGASIDITERKKNETQISHLASFPELNPNPVIEMDLSENVIYTNQAARKRFPDLLELGNKHPFFTGIDDIIKRGEHGSVTTDIMVENRWYERTAAYVTYSQTYRLYVRDITTRKKAEEELRHRTDDLEASNRELEAFSYSVSHDLRAPLRSMEGFSSALLEDYMDKLDEQGKQYLKYIQESSDLMGRLIDDLLKLSRVTRSDINFETVDLSVLAYQIIDELKKTDPQKKVRVNIASGISAYGDRNLLRVVLENLIGNAWKFSSKSTSPQIEMGISQPNGKQAYFVRDNGVGFDMAYVDKLFKPFQRLHKESEFPGTGIGLATVYRIIRRHGGEVWVESKEGEGATFYFTLA